MSAQRGRPSHVPASGRATSVGLKGCDVAAAQAMAGHEQAHKTNYTLFRSKRSRDSNRPAQSLSHRSRGERGLSSLDALSSPSPSLPGCDFRYFEPPPPQPPIGAAHRQRDNYGDRCTDYTSVAHQKRHLFSPDAGARVCSTYAMFIYIFCAEMRARSAIAGWLNHFIVSSRFAPFLFRSRCARN